MLKEIQCDKFAPDHRVIRFNPGLNTVLGSAAGCFWQVEIPQFGSLKLHSILSISFRVLLLVGLITTFGQHSLLIAQAWSAKG